MQPQLSLTQQKYEKEKCANSLHSAQHLVDIPSGRFHWPLLSALSSALEQKSPAVGKMLSSGRWRPRIRPQNWKKNNKQKNTRAINLCAALAAKCSTTFPPFQAADKLSFNCLATSAAPTERRSRDSAPSACVSLTFFVLPTVHFSDVCVWLRWVRDTDWMRQWGMWFIPGSVSGCQTVAPSGLALNFLWPFVNVCVCVCVLAQVPLQVEGSSPGGWELHRGGLHPAASLSPAEGETQTDPHMQNTHIHTHIYSCIKRWFIIQHRCHCLLPNEVYPPWQRPFFFFFFAPFHNKWPQCPRPPADWAPGWLDGVDTDRCHRD